MRDITLQAGIFCCTLDTDNPAVDQVKKSSVVTTGVEKQPNITELLLQQDTQQATTTTTTTELCDDGPVIATTTTTADTTTTATDATVMTAAAAGRSDLVRCNLPGCVLNSCSSTVYWVETVM